MIQFEDFQDVIDIVKKEGNNYKPQDLVRLMMQGGVKAYCNDPSFLYFGWKYIAWELDYGLNPERRPPRIKNPKETGSVCKHLVMVFQVLPFYLGDIIRDMKKLGFFD